MRYDNIEFINKKIDTIKDAKSQIKSVLPTTRISKLKFNLSESRADVAVKMYKLALSLVNKESEYIPVDNYDILVEALKVLESGIAEQTSLKRLCVYANALHFNDIIQDEFDNAIRKNNRDKCLLIISDERRKAEEIEKVRKELKERVEHDRFRKHVLEVQHILSRYMDEDGRPKQKKVNVGLMNGHLKVLYSEQEILEGYREFLDTEPFCLLLQMIERNLRKDA